MTMNRDVWSRRAVAGMLAASLAFVLAPGATLAQNRPDLEIKYSGFSPPTLDHTVTFTVKNVGTAPSSAIKALIQTTQGGPANPSRPDVPALTPGASHVLFYGIGKCDGQVVQASVNDPSDFPGVNDRATQTVECLIKPPTGGGGTSAGDRIIQVDDPQGAVVVAPFPIELIPEHLRVGEHHREFPASSTRQHSIIWFDKGLIPANCPFAGRGGDNTLVGWTYFDQVGCNLNQLYQVILEFELDDIRKLDKKLVFKAELLYTEKGITKTNNDGDDLPLGGCLGKLGLAPRNWEAVVARTGDAATMLTTEATTGDPIPGYFDAEGYHGGWDVTYNVQRAVPKTGFLPIHGLVIHAHNETTGYESDGACVSSIANPRLKIHYVVTP